MKVSLPQPTVNIGMVGHVDHGKSTLTKALTGKKTDVHSEEIKRGISIKLGYADTPIYVKDGEPKEYFNTPVEGAELSRVVSFVDAPGHETLMATMLSGSSIMNGAMLVIAANEKCPQPQTREHLTALEIMGIKNIIIIQNKIDLVTRERAIENYNEIKKFIRGSIADNAPIIPVSAYHNKNIDKVLEAIEEFIPTPKKNEKYDPIMYVARSFDINRPGMSPKELKGGVLGGSLVQGTLKIGDEIEIAPGIQQTKGNKQVWENLFSEVSSLMAGSASYDKIIPGGLSAVGTYLDPFLTKNDSLTGRVLGKAGSVPSIATYITTDSHLLERVVGFDEDMVVEPIKSRESLMLTFGTSNTIGMVSSAKDTELEITLRYPVAVQENQRISIGRRISNRWRLIGYGSVKTFS